MPEDETAGFKPFEFDLFLSKLSDQLGGRELLPSELSCYAKRQVIRGFTYLIACPDGQDRQLDILFTKSFPYTIPLVAIRDLTLFLVWPHVESDGVLCLPTSGKSYNGPDIIGQTIGVFREALTLIQDSASEVWKTKHLQAEFSAYWSQQIKAETAKVIAKISPSVRNRFIPYYKTKSAFFVSDDVSTLKAFINRLGIGDIRENSISNALVLCLPEPLIPATTPRTAKDVENLILRFAPELLPFVPEQVQNFTRETLLIIQVPQGEGVAYGGLRIPKQAASNAYYRSRQRLNGFRPGREPPELLQRQYFGSQKAVHYLSVERFDDAVVRSRENQQNYKKNIRECRIAIVGCGSVGSSVASILAQSGVGHLLLIDHELLKPENLSRNHLGATSVGLFKAKELAREPLIKS